MAIPKGEPVQQTGETAPIAEGNPIARAPSGIPKGEPVGQDVPTFIPDELKREEVEGDFMEKAGALTSAGISLGREAAAVPISGGWGLINLGLSAAAGREDPISDAVRSIETVADAVSGEGPSTPEGQAVLRNLSKDSRVRAIMEQAEEAGGKTLEKTGSPAAATAVQTAMEFLPGLLGTRRGFDVEQRIGTEGEGSRLAPSQKEKSKIEITGEPTDRKVRKEDLKRVRKLIKEEGINVSGKQSLFNSLKRIGENVQDEGFARSLEKVRDAVAHSRNVEKRAEARRWRIARKGGDASVSGEQLVGFRSQLNEALKPYVTDDMPKVNKLLKRLDEKVGDTSDPSAAEISYLYDEWRKGINANMPSDKTSAEARALTEMKRQFDSFVQSQFTADMINGDPQSVARWKAAIDKTKNIKETFDSEEAIRQFARYDATPKELRNYLFNTSSVLSEDGAQRVLQGLKKILGPDSDQMEALRQESLFNVMEPLLKPSYTNAKADFELFSQRYNEFIKKNPDLTKELFDKKSLESLRILNSAAKSAEKRKGLIDKYGSLRKAVADLGAVSAFGHQIAQQGMKVRLAKQFFDRIMTTGDTPIQKEMMEDFLGYDAGKSIFGTPAKRAAALEATTQAVAEEQEDNE